MYRALICASLVFSLLSCSENKQGIQSKPIEVSEIARDIQVPKSLMLEIEKELTEDSKLSTPVYVFVSLQVALAEKNAGVLKEHTMTINFPKGGGRLDLKDLVTGQGTFYFSFPSEQFSKLPELLHLYYISQAPVKKIDQENFGLGCGKYVDLKKKFKSLQKNNFLKLNTTQLRHLFVLAGHYLFEFRENNQVYLAQLTITDSRYASQLCFTNEGVPE